MKQLIKVFAFVMCFSSTLAIAQNTETETEDKKAEKKVEKVYKTDDDKRVYKADKKHLATKKMTAEQKIAAMDANEDGKISIDEASNAENKSYSKYFAKIDTNADGFIDLTELKAKMAKKKNKKDKMKSKPEYNH